MFDIHHSFDVPKPGGFVTLQVFTITLLKQGDSVRGIGEPIIFPIMKYHYAEEACPGRKWAVILLNQPCKWINGDFFFYYPATVCDCV